MLWKPLSLLPWQTCGTADGRVGGREGAGVGLGGDLSFVQLHREMLLLKFLLVGWELLVLTGNENCKAEMTNTESGLREGKAPS